MPDYGRVWRVEFAYFEAVTTWDMVRQKCAVFFNQVKLRGLAGLIWSGKKGAKIMMPEMDSVTPRWSHDSARASQTSASPGATVPVTEQIEAQAQRIDHVK